MPQVATLPERHHDPSATRVAVTITGDVSPAEQVDALAIFEDLTRDARDGVRCTRCRIDARLKADGLSIVDGASSSKTDACSSPGASTERCWA